MCDQCDSDSRAQERKDMETGTVHNPNYGYTEPGMNVGLGVYIKDKEHFKRVEQELKAEEGIRNAAS